MIEQYGCLDDTDLDFSVRASYGDEAIERPIRHRSVGDGCLPGRTYDEAETEYHDEMDAIQQSPTTPRLMQKLNRPRAIQATMKSLSSDLHC